MAKVKDIFLSYPVFSFAVFVLIVFTFIHTMFSGVFEGLVSSLGLALSILGALLVFFSIILSVVLSSSWKEYSFLGASEFDLLTAYSISARLIRTKSFRFSLGYLFLLPVVWDKVQQGGEKFSGLLLSAWGWSG
ncbi:MAG: hypothetical protein IKZ87_07260, partial [Actinomycetaceae bacterium]|nr:hypothetical protein [Actinomycetaceae bacterium]